jgi:hypothetical protein
MGGIAAKTFPWPTAIGASSNVSPLVKSQAPTLNGPAGATNGPTTAATPLSGATGPNTSNMPVAAPTPFRPIGSGGGNAPPAPVLSGAFYGR